MNHHWFSSPNLRFLRPDCSKTQERKKRRLDRGSRKVSTVRKYCTVVFHVPGMHATLKTKPQGLIRPGRIDYTREKKVFFRQIAIGATVGKFTSGKMTAASHKKKKLSRATSRSLWPMTVQHDTQQPRQKIKYYRNFH